LGRTKKYIEVSGRPGPTEFLSSQYSSHLDRYNLTFRIESVPDLDEIKLLYRKLMVSEMLARVTTYHISHSRANGSKNKLLTKTRLLMSIN
jgi:hypothetical protein